MFAPNTAPARTAPDALPVEGRIAPLQDQAAVEQVRVSRPPHQAAHARGPLPIQSRMNQRFSAAP